MAQYRILYVDEDESDIRRFQRYVYHKDEAKEFNLEVIIPATDLNEFLEYIQEENFDAIITDHKLQEQNANISFDGVELVRELLNLRIDFPCFVLTSFDDEAIVNGDDVNIVYVKGLMDEDGENKVHATFLDKIKNQIIHHRKKIANSRAELIALLDNEFKDAKDESRIIELDTYIEKTTNVPSSLPPLLKSAHNLSELHKMIENTDKLLATIKGK